jgi:hypothetical protein
MIVSTTSGTGLIVIARPSVSPSTKYSRSLGMKASRIRPAPSSARTRSRSRGRFSLFGIPSLDDSTDEGGRREAYHPLPGRANGTGAPERAPKL